MGLGAKPGESRISVIRMDFGEKFKIFTIHTVMCGGGTPYAQKNSNRLYENLTSHPGGDWGVRTPGHSWLATTLSSLVCF